MTQPIQAVGMPWFRPETFDRLRAMFDDGHKLHRTYDEWLRAAEAGRKAQEARGVKVVCADIDPDDFPKWCKAKGMKLDANARTRYAAEIAYKALMAPPAPGPVQ